MPIGYRMSTNHFAELPLARNPDVLRLRCGMVGALELLQVRHGRRLEFRCRAKKDLQAAQPIFPVSS